MNDTTSIILTTITVFSTFVAMAFGIYAYELNRAGFEIFTGQKSSNYSNELGIGKGANFDDYIENEDYPSGHEYRTNSVNSNASTVKSGGKRKTKKTKKINKKNSKRNKK
jgi:hypothetical protein